MSSENEQKVTIKGSCHCGFVKYTCTPTISSLKTAVRCNCTFCTKLAAANMHLSSASDFTLLSPSSKSEIADYQANNPNAHRYFCQKCGTQIWMEAKYEMFGKQIEHFSVNLHSVDQPQKGEGLYEEFDLSEVKFGYYDGLNGNFQGGLKEQPWKGGLV